MYIGTNVQTMKLNRAALCWILCQTWLIEAQPQQQDTSQFDPIDHISDFRMLSKLPNFVDKTDLLPMVITNATNHTFQIFTAPRKFGKSTIIDMIRRFVELPINSTSGEIINKTRTTNYKLFTNSSLKITRNKEFIREHMAEYPTLVVNFTDIRGTTLQQQLPSIKAALQKTARKYAWLYWLHANKPVVKSNDTDIVVNNLRYEGIGRLISGEASQADLIDGLQDLSRAIFDHFGKEPFVLIDAFDTPMQLVSGKNIFETENVTRFVNDVLFMGIRFGPFISHHVVVTGTSGSFANIAAQDTTIQTPGFLRQSNFAPYFGLTSDECDRLLDTKNIPNEEREKIDLYYNGYYCSDSTTKVDHPIKIYQIHSIQKYLRERTKTGKPNYRNYWQQTGTMEELDFYLNAPAIRGMLYNLILRKSLKLQVPETFGYKELEQLKELKNNQNPFQTDDGTLYFIFFIEHGYLSRKDFNNNNERDRYYIANLDAEFEIIDRVYSFYRNHNLRLDPIAELFVKLLQQATVPADTLRELKTDIKKIVEILPDANRLSFQTMLFCAARLRYPLTTTRLVAVDESAANTNVIETNSIDVIVRNDQQDVLHLFCAKNKQIMDAILKEAKNAYPQDYQAAEGRQNKILGIYLGDHNTIDFEIVQ